MDLLPLLQLLALGFLGKFLHASTDPSKWKNFWALTITAGLGFYAWTAWVPIWIWLILILAHRCWKGKKEDRWFLIAFVSSTILVVLPLVLARLSSGGSAHIKQILNLSDWRPLFSYMKCLFWNGLPTFPFGSNWGGLLNPIFLSLAFLGILEYFRCASWNFLGAVTTLALLCFLPGALTNDLEIHRVFIFLPLLTWMAVPGIQSLFPNPLKSVAKTGITLLLLSSFSLDAYNFLIPYSDTHYSPPDRQWRNIQYYDAYKTLEKLSQQQGCLYIF